MKPRLLPILALAALAACGSSPKEFFYTLGGDATPAPPSSAASAAAYSVTVGPVSVPDMVDRPQLVLREAANQVTLVEQSRWAEPLRSAIPRVIAGNLAEKLPDARLAVYPQTAGEGADLHVWTDIQRFDSTPGEGVVVEAVWTVRGKDEERSGRSLVRESAQGKDHYALVAAHNTALRVISNDIANAIREISPPRADSATGSGSAARR